MSTVLLICCVAVFFIDLILYQINNQHLGIGVIGVISMIFASIIMFREAKIQSVDITLVYVAASIFALSGIVPILAIFGWNIKITFIKKNGG